MAKQRFLSNMSHELRTPLQAIIGYADLLRQQQQPSRDGIEAIYQSSGHLLQVVNEVLDYNRIISGKFTFSQQPVHVRDLLEEVIAAMRGQRSEEHTSELQSLMRISYAVFCLKKKKHTTIKNKVQ